MSVCHYERNVIGDDRRMAVDHDLLSKSNVGQLSYNTKIEEKHCILARAFGDAVKNLL